MKNILFLSLMCSILLSCSSDDDTNKGKSATNIDVAIIFRVKSDEGIDLLNPNNPNSYQVNDIKIYYLVNGISQEVYNPNMDSPRNFNITHNNDAEDQPYIMQVYLNSSQNDGAITYIKWNETETDTIKANYDSGSNSVVKNKVWYNDKLVWEKDSNNVFYFEIIK